MLLIKNAGCRSVSYKWDWMDVMDISGWGEVQSSLRLFRLLVVEELKLQDQNYGSSAYLLLNNHQLYAGPIGVVQYCITTPCTVKHVFKVTRGGNWNFLFKWE